MPGGRGIRVAKGQAYGNDFLFVPEPDAAGLDITQLARAMCDRHAGVGADGLIVYALNGNHATARFLNADGSPAEISGNGIRCLGALIVHTHQGKQAAPIVIDTPAGSRTLDFLERSGNRITFRASMGQPRDIRVLELDAAGEKVRVVALSVGNPQCVVLGQSLDEQRMLRLGPALERHAAFPHRTNVSFVEVPSPESLRILIWERGVGPTAASGTGACGAAVAAAAHGGAARDVQVTSPGGTQRVEWRHDGIYLTGWAELVFEGRWLAVSA